MKYLLFLAIACSSMVILYNSCTYDVLGEPIVAEFCDTATITYNNQIKPIIDNSCAYSGCHAGGAPGNFTTYAGLATRLATGSFENRVITQKDNSGIGMPPNYAPSGKPQDLTAEELELIECWLAQGAPE